MAITADGNRLEQIPPLQQLRTGRNYRFVEVLVAITVLGEATVR